MPNNANDRLFNSKVDLKFSTAGRKTAIFHSFSPIFSLALSFPLFINKKARAFPLQNGAEQDKKVKQDKRFYTFHKINNAYYFYY